MNATAGGIFPTARRLSGKAEKRPHSTARTAGGGSDLPRRPACMRFATPDLPGCGVLPVLSRATPRNTAAEGLPEKYQTAETGGCTHSRQQAGAAGHRLVRQSIKPTYTAHISGVLPIVITAQRCARVQILTIA